VLHVVGCIEYYSEDINFISSDLESAQKMGSGIDLGTHITIFGYGECYREDIEFPSSDLESP
jgi:hypothetical protein